jgi:hypothetical protein
VFRQRKKGNQLNFKVGTGLKNQINTSFLSSGFPVNLPFIFLKSLLSPYNPGPSGEPWFSFTEAFPRLPLFLSRLAPGFSGSGCFRSSKKGLSGLNVSVSGEGFSQTRRVLGNI